MAREYKLHRHHAPASGIDYRAELNAEQYAAVSSPPGRALVIAGAGSGKTRTLTYRVAWLLDHGVQSREILLLTFTNKAAREMINRVRDLVNQDTSDLWAGTFHSIGNRILRRHAEELGFTRSFSILDRDDQKSLLTGVIAACDIDTKVRRFPKADVLASIFSLIENTGESLEDLLSIRYPYFQDWLEKIAQV
ncbi:MAG TPA: UvrD-helicase domain-containing protein, partial [Luteolibacter sp.]